MKQLISDFCKKIVYGFGFGTGMSLPYYYMNYITPKSIANRTTPGKTNKTYE